MPRGYDRACAGQVFALLDTLPFALTTNVYVLKGSET